MSRIIVSTYFFMQKNIAEKIQKALQIHICKQLLQIYD